jgi:hypothetical protein
MQSDTWCRYLLNCIEPVTTFMAHAAAIVSMSWNAFQIMMVMVQFCVHGVPAYTPCAAELPVGIIPHAYTNSMSMQCHNVAYPK